MDELRFRQVHLDFHTSEKIVGIGSKFDAGKFARTLKQAHVNSVTCFSRGHHGMIFHDTRFEHARHPHLECNLLAEQIEACHAEGIRVPIYITVGLDEHSYQQHPEWCEVGPDGKPSAGPLDARWHKMCLNMRGPYMRYVADQTREVLGMFDVDGLFFDIISQGGCCCPVCMESMAEAGVDPTNDAQRVAYGKGIVDEYKREFAKLVRGLNADCTIFHNSGHIYPSWRPILDTYTHLELESLPSGGWGYAHFPITMRYARRLGLECLGMTGKFHTTWGDFSSFKHQEALEYEVFTQIAHGAKCSIGDQLHPTGEPCPETYRLIGSVYSHVEALEPWLSKAEGEAEIAVFNPEALGIEDGRVDSAAGGAYHMLVEAQHQFDYVDTESDLSRYKVLILADKIPLDDGLAAKVKAFLAGGGAVIASHKAGLDPGGTAFALQEFGLEYVGDAEFQPDFVLAGEQINDGTPAAPHVMYEKGTEVKLTGAEALADVYDPYFNRTYEHFCSHQHAPLERKADRPAVTRNGNVIYLAHPVFGMYQRRGARFWKQLALNCLDLLLPEPMVKTNLPTTAQVTVTRQGARRMIHIIHYIPERRATGIDTIQDIIPLHDVKVSLKSDAEPTRVYIAPSGDELEWELADEHVQVCVPKVEGYAVVVLE